MPKIKNWRPQGWVNPYKVEKVKSLNIPEGTRLFKGGMQVMDTSAIINSFNELEARLFEAGADAMLKAQRKEGWRPEQEPDHRLLSYRAVNDMMTVSKMRKGVWFFIPDEEESYAKSKV